MEQVYDRKIKAKSKQVYDPTIKAKSKQVYDPKNIPCYTEFVLPDRRLPVSKNTYIVVNQYELGQSRIIKFIVEIFWGFSRPSPVFAGGRGIAKQNLTIWSKDQKFRTLFQFHFTRSSECNAHWWYFTISQEENGGALQRSKYAKLGPDILDLLQ